MKYIKVFDDNIERAYWRILEEISTGIIDGMNGKILEPTMLKQKKR